MAGWVLYNHIYAETLKPVSGVLVGHFKGGIKGFPFKRGFLFYLKADLGAQSLLGGGFRSGQKA